MRMKTCMVDHSFEAAIRRSPNGRIELRWDWDQLEKDTKLYVFLSLFTPETNAMLTALIVILASTSMALLRSETV